MDKPRITQVLNVPDNTLMTIRDVRTVAWGQTLIFHCTCSPTKEELISFRIVFVDCRDLRWRLYSHVDSDGAEPFPDTPLQSFQMGRGQHQKAADMLTAHFGLSIMYGELLLETQNETVKLA